MRRLLPVIGWVLLLLTACEKSPGHIQLEIDEASIPSTEFTHYVVFARNPAGPEGEQDVFPDTGAADECGYLPDPNAYCLAAGCKGYDPDDATFSADLGKKIFPDGSDDQILICICAMAADQKPVACGEKTLDMSTAFDGVTKISLNDTTCSIILDPCP